MGVLAKMGRLEVMGILAMNVSGRWQPADCPLKTLPAGRSGNPVAELFRNCALAPLKSIKRFHGRLIHDRRWHPRRAQAEHEAHPPPRRQGSRLHLRKILRLDFRVGQTASPATAPTVNHTNASIERTRFDNIIPRREEKNCVHVL